MSAPHHRPALLARWSRVTVPVRPACEAPRHDGIDAHAARAAGEDAPRRAVLAAGKPDAAAAIVFPRQPAPKGRGHVTGQRVPRRRLPGEPAERVEYA